jgi:hypothetical protein
MRSIFAYYCSGVGKPPPRRLVLWNGSFKTNNSNNPKMEVTPVGVIVMFQF